MTPGQKDIFFWAVEEEEDESQKGRRGRKNIFGQKGKDFSFKKVFSVGLKLKEGKLQSCMSVESDTI